MVTRARTTDVSTRLPALLLRVCREQGISSERLLAGLGISESDLADPEGFIGWDDDLVFRERVEVAVGGAAALQQILGSAALRHPAVHYLASLHPGPRSLYLYSLERPFRKLYPGAGFRVDALPDGRLRMEVRLPRSCRGSETFFRSEIGALRVYPRLFGLPEAQVDAEITPHLGVFLISLPTERSRPSRAGRAVREAMARLRTGTAPPEEGRELDLTLLPEAESFVVDPDLLASAARLGQSLIAHRDLPGLGDAVAQLLAEQCCCDRLALWVAGAEPETETLVYYSGDCRLPFQCTCGLRARGRDVGRLEADVPGASDGGPPPFLVALAPWAALAVEACMRRAGGIFVDPERLDSLSCRVDRARRAWQLTEREAQTLSLVAQGLANKEIADRFGCSVKGVEAHLTRLLRKSSSDSRATLLARLIQPSPG